jgi:hypothetical protein
MLFLLFTLTQGFADPFDLNDTGANTLIQEDTFDPVDLWPEKIVLDANANQMLLVWFDTNPPRNTTIPFDDIRQLNLIPNHELREEELQIALKDGRIFLLDFGLNSRHSAQTFSAVTFNKLKKADPKKERILPEHSLQRNAPVLVLGSISGKEALTPPSRIVRTTITKPEEYSLQSVGEDFNIGKATGKVSDTSVDMTIKRSMNRFRGCYIKEVSKNPTLGGRITVEFSISIEGEVNGAKILNSELKNPVVEKCILQHLQGIEFDPSVGGTAIITYPFIFSMAGL